MYKKGKFSTTEDQHLKAAIESYREVYSTVVVRAYSHTLQTKGLSEEQLLELIFSKNEKNKDNDFWSAISVSSMLFVERVSDLDCQLLLSHSDL